MVICWVWHSGMTRNSTFSSLCFGRWDWNIIKTTARIPVLWDHILIGDMFCLFTSSECSCFKLMSQLHHFSQLNVSIPSETTNRIHLNNRVPIWKTCGPTSGLTMATCSHIVFVLRCLDANAGEPQKLGAKVLSLTSTESSGWQVLCQSFTNIDQVPWKSSLA